MAARERGRGGGGGKDILSFFKDVQFENKKMRILAQNS